MRCTVTCGSNRPSLITDTISKDTIPPVLENQFHEAVSQPLKDWKDDFPSYEACIQKRDGLARDVDAYERKLVALEDKAIDKRDPAEIARRKDQLARAESEVRGNGWRAWMVYLGIGGWCGETCWM